MARDNFRDLCNTLYTNLVAYCCIPQVEIDGVVTDQLERPFFPDGTAATVLTFSKLERLFTSIIPGGQATTAAFRPAQLAQNVEARKLHKFLAILIILRCDIEPFLSFTEKLVAPQTWTAAECALAKLPAEHRDSLRAIFGDDITANIFFQKQHDFFAPIIEKNKEVRSQFRRVPYVREKLIGQGSFGKIYEVVISPHHFQDGDSMLNKKELTLARKDFELNAADRAHEKERDVLREIVRNAKKHGNIMNSLGSLEIGSTYSLFMPLALYDLKQYMELYPTPPKSSIQKEKIVKRAVGLAGAIVYLHDELESPVYEKLSCFHMDLKPQNILVVIDPKTGEEEWRQSKKGDSDLLGYFFSIQKLSDFNMSRVKPKRNQIDDPLSLRRSLTFSENVYEINKLFKRRVLDASEASVAEHTINRRGAGTYLAPEACVEGHPVQGESDTWSLGCVISVVFTYLYGGQEAVEAFAGRRYEKMSDDRFFSFSGGSVPHKLGDAQVNDAVKRWHKHLRMKTKQENPDEGAIFEAMIRFLGRKVLIIDPKQRRGTTAGDVRDKLIDAFKAYRNMSSNSPISLRSPRSRFRMPGFIKPPGRRQSVVEVDTQDWRLQSPAIVKTCFFGPNAQPLVCVTDSVLTAYSLEHVLLSSDPRDSNDFDEDLMTYGQATPQHKGRLWGPNVSVSAQYILAATDHYQFDCYFYHIAQPGNHNSELKLVAHWQPELPRIAKLALSPDAQYAAFVLSSATSHQQNGSLYITRLDLLEAAKSDGKPFSIMSSSTASSSDPSSPLGRAIPLPCLAEDVCELKFSPVNGLYVVAKNRLTNNMTENVMHVFAWSVQGGRRTALAPSPIKHDGKDDILQGIFTCFAPYNQNLAFAVVSQEKRVIIRAWNLQRYTQSNARGYRLLQILLDHDDREILAFGTREAHNELQLLTLPTANARDDLEIKSGRKLPAMTHQSKFVAAITTTSTGSLTQRHLLIAILEGLTVRIARVGLDP